MKRKAYGVAAAIFLLFGTAAASLPRISGSAQVVAAAQGQSLYRLEVAKARGRIYDKDLEPLAGGSERTVAAVAPTIEAIGALESATGGTMRDRLRTALEDGKPFLLEVDEDVADRLRGQRNIRLFQVPQRYSEDQLAPHVIGYVDGAGEGVSGVELAMEDALARVDGQAAVTYQVDALGRVIPGGEVQVEDSLEEARAGVALTLETDIQALAESAGAALGKGAVVVTEVPGCEIRGMASFPSFSPLALGKAAQDPDGPLVNRALSAYAPGSVFKLSVAAAALEAGLPLKEFNCVGSVNAGGLLFHCYDGLPHGTVGLREALERSCNCYFINCARSLGGQSILSMAYNLGLGESQEFGRGLFSQAGDLPDAQSLTNERALANTAFGQGAVTVTPLQMCGLVNAIASGGVYQTPRLILGTVDRDKRLTEVSPVTDRTVRVMRERSALLLANAMRETVRSGTARPGDPGNGVAGAKTGTAQTGVFDEAGQELLHFWYCGFVEDEAGPRYCVTVLAESTPDDQGAAAKAFRTVARGLLDRINGKAAASGA